MGGAKGHRQLRHARRRYHGAHGQGHERAGRMTLVELADGVSLENIRAATGADYAVSPGLKPMQQ